MKDKNIYTLVLFLTGIYTTYVSIEFLQSNRNWVPIVLISFLIIISDIFPIKMPNGLMQSGSTLGILYLMHTMGISASTVPILVSAILFFLLVTRPFYRINWYRLFSTIGMYFISVACAATTLVFTNQLSLILQVIFMTFVFENVNSVVRAGIMKFTNNVPLFYEVTMMKIVRMQVSISVVAILLYQLLKQTNLSDLLIAAFSAVFLMIVINFLISAYNRHIYKIEESKQRYQSLFKHNPDIVFTLDLSGNITSINPMVEKTLGYTPDAILGYPLFEYLIRLGKEEAILPVKQSLLGHPQQFTMRFPTIEGKSRDLFITCGPTVVNDQIVGIYAIAKDISEQKQAEQIIHRMAYFDEITGLPNRSHFQACMAETMEKVHSTDLVGLMFLDLDKFKQVNDTLGHHTGDLLLVEVSKRIMHVMPAGAHVFRLGGDEFTIVLRSLHSNEEAIQTAEAILRSLTEPFYLQDSELYITTSIGICLYPEHGQDMDTLIKHADAAMYQAKGIGGNTYSIYSNDIQVRNESKHKIHAHLRKAILRDEFYLKYQPKIDLISNRINGVEALIRWNNPELGKLSPAQFIPIAEESGLILSIGEWVLRTACKQNRAWQDEGFPPIVISVNLSSKQLQNDQLVSTMKQVLEETKLDPKWLEIEITESILLQNTQHTLKVLKEIKELGVAISIDDFGVGYSSLSYLKHFSFDYLKMDKSFIENLNISSKDELIISGIIKLAHSLNMKVIAEGVESNPQLTYLREQGCDGVQGYLISKPLSAGEFVEQGARYQRYIPRNVISTRHDK